MQTVLAAVDNSPYTAVVAEYACDLAAIAGAGVLAAYVIDTRLVEGVLARLLAEVLAAHAGPDAGEALSDLLERHGREALCGAEEVCARRKVPCRTTLGRGRPAEALAAMAPLYDLAVVGSFGSEAEFRSSFLGSTATDFVRLSTRPILLVRREYRPLRHIVVGYDASPEASRALAAVLPLALSAKWVLTLAVGGYDESRAAEIAAQAAGLQGLADVCSNIVVRPRDPADVLLDLVDELSADLLVVGSRGLNKAARRLMGSTSDTLVRESPVPVMVFK
jgi:nucleotide-binding universal stress UspA family protein